MRLPEQARCGIPDELGSTMEKSGTADTWPWYGRDESSRLSAQPGVRLLRVASSPGSLEELMPAPGSHGNRTAQCTFNRTREIREERRTHRQIKVYTDEPFVSRCTQFSLPGCFLRLFYILVITTKQRLPTSWAKKSCISVPSAFLSSLSLFIISPTPSVLSCV